MANDALDFGSNNNTAGQQRSFTVDVSGGLVLPASTGWAVGCWVRMSNGFLTTADFQYLISGGALGGTNSLHLFFGESSNFRMLLVRTRGSGAEINQTCVSNIGDGTTGIDTTDRLMILQLNQSTGNLECYWVAKGAAVSAPTSTPAAWTGGDITFPSLCFGRRPDNGAARWFTNIAGEFFVINDGYLTAAEVEDIAAGVHIDAVWPTVAVDLRFRGDNATETDQSGNGYDATRVGSGFTLVNEFFPDGSTAISGALESISLSTFVATVSSDRAIAGAREEIALTANAATVSTDRSVSAVVEQITLSALAATVQANIDTNIAAALQAITLSTFGASFALQVNAQAEQITLGTFISVISSDRQISASVESIALQTHGASVSTGSVINAGTEQIVLQAQPASVALNVSLSAQRQAIVLTQLAAQIALSSNIDAQLESLTLTPFGSTITLNNGIQAQLESLTLTTFNALLTLPTSPILAPGLEYTLRGDRMHFTMPANKLHFTFRS